MSDMMELICSRHSVRQYQAKPLNQEDITALEREIHRCNEESGLHIQLVTNETRAFSGLMAHYGKFRNAVNYFAMIGRKTPDLEEKCGYYGEQLVLFAQSIGLNTCWVAGTYSKVPEVFQVAEDEKLVMIISVGYGENQGKSRRSKAPDKVAKTTGSVPGWFARGVEAALLAPTAINQQKFRFILHEDGTVTLKAGIGPFVKTDLGIVRLHFELGAGTENFKWRE